MSKTRDIFGHIDRHDVNRAVSVTESDNVFEFRVVGEPVGSLTFRTPGRDQGVTPEAVIAAVEDHLLSFDPSRGETEKSVSLLVESRVFLAAGRDRAKIVKSEIGGEGEKKTKAPEPVGKSEAQPPKSKKVK